MHHHIAFVEFAPVADIAVVVAAVLSLICLMALFLIAEFIASLFGRLPWPLSLAAGVAKSVAHAARDAMVWVFDGTLHFLSWSWHMCVRFLEDLFNELRVTGNVLLDITRKIIEKDIPRLNHQLRSRITQVRREGKRDLKRESNRLFQIIASVAKALRKDITKTAHHIETELQHDVKVLRAEDARLDKSLRHLIAAVRQDLTAELRAAVRALTSRIDARFQAAEHLARQLYQSALQKIAVALADAEQYARQQARQAEQDAVTEVDREAHKAMAAAWPEVTAMIGQLEKVAGNDFPELQRLLHDIPENIPQDLLGALTVAVRFIPPMLETTTECTIPTCRDLGSTRQFIHNLQLPITSAALIAWFIEMITDPEAWANQTHSFLSPLVNAEYTVLKDLLGV